MSHRGVLLAVGAGACAALASVCGKLALDDNVRLGGAQLTLAARGVAFVLLVLLNAKMWTLFTQSLNAFPSSVHPTAINTAANFVLSAVIGHLLFGEPLPLKWWLGTALLTLGVVLLHLGEVRREKAKRE
jgi:multidrug transporter EmrE-like cation transporter